MNFDDSQTFPGVMRGPTKNLGPIGSAVLTFIGYKQTNKQPNKQTNRQTDKQSIYIYRYSNKSVEQEHDIKQYLSVFDVKKKISLL